MLERTEALLLQVSPPGSDLRQVRSFGRIRQSSSMDSCHAYTAVRLVSGSSNRLKGSMPTTATPRCWSLGQVHKDFLAIINKAMLAPVWEWQQRHVRSTILVIRWSIDIDVICLMFEVLCTSGESYNRSKFFSQKATTFVRDHSSILFVIYFMQISGRMKILRH